MTVRQIADLAKNSELNGIALANRDEAVIGFMNLGILELYKRFQLKVEEYVITLVEGQDIYSMPSNYMWIVAAYGEVDIRSTETVNELPINEEDNPLSINTVGWNKVQIPVSVAGAYVSIIYVAQPETYEMSDIEVDLPPQMIDALLAFIGYKANAAIDSGVQTEDSAWYQRFEHACDKLREYGMVNGDDMYMNQRITTRGFV